jgi:cytochrome c-type biogenesis protein
MRDFVVDTLFDGNLLLALPVAAVAGVIYFLSPCVLPLVPGYVAYATGFAQSKGKVLLGSTLFVFGFTTIFVSYGAAFGGLGSLLIEHERPISYVLGAMTIVMGLIFMGIFPMTPTLRPKMSTTGGIIGAPLLGFLFGIGWTPCIGPALATVQTLSFQEASALRGSILSIAFSVGLGIPFILSGLYLDKSKKLRTFLVQRGDVVARVGGVLLVVIGILQITGTWNSLMIDLRSLISGFVPVI